LTYEYSRKWLQSFPDDVSRTREIPNKSLYALLEQTTENVGAKIALIADDGQKISYEQLKDKVDRLAGAWYRMGLQKGERIGLMLPNTPYYVISYYAAMRLGLVVVQINPNYTIRELVYIIKDAELNHIVIQEDQFDYVMQFVDMYNISNLFVTESTIYHANVLAQLIEDTPPLHRTVPIDIVNDIAVIQYTSGTTGKMKGVMLTQANLVANVFQNYAVYGDKIRFGAEIVFTAIPLYHVYAMTSAMNIGIFIGATNVLLESYDVDAALLKIKKYQPTFFPGVPRMYIDFIHHPNAESYNLDCLRFCLCGSAPLPVDVIKKFERLTGTIIAEGYGLSEASPSTHRNPPLGVRKIGSIGTPLPHTESKIVDDEGNELPVQSVGELIVKGPQVMKGYWRNKEETVNALRNGWLYTADLARQDEDGYFYIVGRKKEMIISNGFNVSPVEVEQILHEHPDVKEVAVVGIPDAIEGERIKAFVALKEGSTVLKEELKGHCYQELTAYKIPKEFEFIDELPRNSVGKVIKTKLITMTNRN